MTMPSAIASSSLDTGSSQAIEVASSLAASRTASAAATRAFSASISPRLPRPTTSALAGFSG